jgi:hypothetical protein
MGAWATDAFGNDDACDWACELKEVKDLSLVEETLDTVLSVGAEYLEAPHASEALVAVEVIARLQGNWGERSSYSEDVDKWVERIKIQPSSALIQKAYRVIDRILADNSELKELWQDSAEYEDWLASVQELRDRVRAIP